MKISTSTFKISKEEKVFLDDTMQKVSRGSSRFVYLAGRNLPPFIIVFWVVILGPFGTILALPMTMVFAVLTRKLRRLR